MSVVLFRLSLYCVYGLLTPLYPQHTYKQEIIRNFLQFSKKLLEMSIYFTCSLHWRYWEPVLMRLSVLSTVMFSRLKTIKYQCFNWHIIVEATS